MLNYSLVSMATRVLSIVSDGLVVALTWAKTYRTYRLSRSIKLRTNVAAMILRDGELWPCLQWM